jgi:hypothetical protein
MAIKTFTTGEVLTASDTNTYLANSGLVYISAVNVSGTPSSIAGPAACFSSTYDHYKIIVSNLDTDTSAQLRMTFGATVTGYYYGNPLTTMIGGGYEKNNGSNLAYIDLGPVNSGWNNDFNFDVFAPNKATLTKVSGFGYVNSAQYGGMGTGLVDGTTQYTSFTLTLSSGTMSAGTVAVYGYRKA